LDLDAFLEKAQSEMTIALSDSFDTPRALRIIDQLIKQANIHMQAAKSALDVRGLEKIGRWITKMVGIFGLDSNATPPYNELGWASSATNTSLTPEQRVASYADVHKRVKDQVEALDLHSEALNKLLSANVDSEFAARVSNGISDTEALAMPYIRGVSRIRDELRKLAPSLPSKKAILALSDQIRDTDLTNLGVYLDDGAVGADEGAFIKFIPKEELFAQKEEKASKEREKVAQKEAARLERERLEAEKLEKAKVPHTEMFKDERYSAWDDKGIPTKTKDGEDVPKGQLKKIKKEWEKQRKLHEEWKTGAKS